MAKFASFLRKFGNFPSFKVDGCNLPFKEQFLKRTRLKDLSPKLAKRIKRIKDFKKDSKDSRIQKIQRFKRFRKFTGFKDSNIKNIKIFHCTCHILKFLLQNTLLPVFFGFSGF